MTRLALYRLLWEENLLIQDTVFVNRYLSEKWNTSVETIAKEFNTVLEFTDYNIDKIRKTIENSKHQFSAYQFIKNDLFRFVKEKLGKKVAEANDEKTLDDYDHSRDPWTTNQAYLWKWER